MNKWFYRFFFEPLRSVMAGNKTVAVLFIILGALLLYLPCLSYDFFAVDDWAYVQKNEFIRSFSWDHLRIFFTRSFVNLWLPVTMLSYSLDHTIWGTNAFGYHFTNLVLHLLNIFFVYHLFLRLKCPHSIAILSSAIFAIHPVQIESVVWISERKNVLSFFFFLLSCLHWLSWLQTRKGSSGVFTLFFFALSVFSKPVFVFGPVLFAIAAASFSDDGIFQTKKDIIKKHLEGKGLAILLGCAALGLTAICMTLYSHASGQSLTLPLSYTGRERFLTALTLPWAYSKNLLFPFSLSIS
ncbi:MAG: glycosyltransferase family 39 protein, partial [Candidatus Aureabacteria bacterium]|nr:glycosyltransferase family 39 protein [Candidatus Auribacterota bacterium]